MKNRLFALILAFAMLFALSACNASSSSTSTTTVSGSITDDEGNTTTSTVTNETVVSTGPDGGQTKDETTTETIITDPEESASAAESMADFFPPKEEWFDIYSEGGEGTNEAGDRFYFAYNDPDNVTYAMILIAFADGSIMVRNGEVVQNEEDSCLEIIDEEMNAAIPFVFLETEEEGSFAVHFLANDTEVLFTFIDQDTIISDIYSILSNSVSNSQTAAEADGGL